ncbi:PHD finger protein 10 [Armadillidium vulgare]|nr:PHD finger protein 10 [Armadillidium vulgare]
MVSPSKLMMESDSDPNKSEKRKLSESENETDNCEKEADSCKKVHLDSDVISTTPSTEEPLLPKSNSPVPSDSLTPKESMGSSIIGINEEKDEKEVPVSIVQSSEQHVAQHDADLKDKEVPVSIVQSSEQHVAQHDANLKNKEGIITKCSFDNISNTNNSESVETPTLFTESSSANLIEQNKEVSDTLIDYETSSKLPCNQILEGDTEKSEKESCTPEVGNTMHSNTQNISSSDIKDSEDKLDSAIADLEAEKELSSEAISNIISSVSSECKESPSFEGTLKNVSPISNIVAEADISDKKCIVSTIIKPPLNTETTFVPIPQSETSTGLCNELEAELDKKSEVSAMEVESNNITPVEGSLVETPCDSGETSPSTSTPADSCQVSAAPSPLLKEDPIVSESLLDDSSMDTKDIPDENEEDKELENIKPVRFGRRRKKTMVQKYKKGKRKSTPMLVDEETRMSATGTPELGLDEDSQSSVGTTSKKETRRYKSEVIVPESTETFTAEKVFEYIWPLEGLCGEHYFIQENISQYLGISSFKRRYPDLKRRPIESQEKEYLKDLGLVTEIACDLGLTAVRSEDMLDIMFNDFPSKYEELQRVLREKKENQLKEKGKVEYQIVNLDKSKMKEYSRKAALNASKWNAAFNRERHEERRYSFDLQTFSLHMPISHGVKLPQSATKLGSYPVAVLPGQYTDYCKIYSSSELKGMPLQTVLSGPFTAEELAAEAQEDSDDDTSVVASVGTCPEFKEEPETTLPIDPLSAEKQPRCKVCNGGRGRNKDGKPEPLIICGTCRTPSHPTCIDLTLAMITKIESYSWQCMDCKTCAQCNDPDDEERMIFCDMCDRGYHIYCVGLRRVPNGRWHCKECAVCFTCGSRNPAGNEHIKNAEWQHEFKKDKDNKQLRYACTLCMPCDKYWKRRQFCSVCMKVYRSIPEDGMVRCMGCPKYVHKDGCSILQDNERFCNYCYKSRNSTALTHSRIIAAAKKKMATGSPMWKS